MIYHVLVYYTLSIYNLRNNIKPIYVIIIFRKNSLSYFIIVNGKYIIKIIYVHICAHVHVHAL